MEKKLIIGFVFFISYFIESIFGFGGTIIALTILSFLIETKEIVLLALYVGTVGSFLVIATDYKSFSKKDFMFMFPTALIGTILGVILFTSLSNMYLLKIFAVMLMIFTLQSLFFNKETISNNFLQRGFVFLGGVLHGLFGTGGPFTILAMKNKFIDKSNLRTTMAVFFVSFNCIRFVQLSIQNAIDYQYIFSYWWLAFFISLAIFLGYKIHLKFNEHYFRMGMNFLLLFAGIVLLLK